MREPTKDPKRLSDILQSIDTILRYVEGMTKDNFISDKRTYHAVIYNIMVIGEAANMLTFEFRETHPATVWRQITNMRNFLIHGYHNVEEDLVWETVESDLPKLRLQIVQYLKELGTE